MLTIENVNKNFGNRQIIKNISLQVKKGEIVALVGPNGAGKTTLISILLGMLQPSSGQATIFGQACEKKNQKIGAMLQESVEINKLTVDETFSLFQSYYTLPLSKEELYKLTDLEEQKKTFTNKLSGGQKRRLNFGLAMVGNPELLFLDEPTTGMDVMSRQNFWKQIDYIIGQGKTVILTTHYLEEIEQRASRILLMKKGEIIHDGTLETIQKELCQTHISFNYSGEIKRNLLNLPYVIKCEKKKEKVMLLSDNSDETIIEMVHQQLPFHSLEIKKTSLEDVFMSLVDEETQGEEIYE